MLSSYFNLTDYLPTNTTPISTMGTSPYGYTSAGTMGMSAMGGSTYGMNMLPMVLIPLITTLFSNVISTVIMDIHSMVKGVIVSIYGLIIYIANRWILGRYSGYNKIYIKAIYNADSRKIVNMEAMPLVWYFNKVIEDIHIEQSVMVCQEYDASDSKKDKSTSTQSNMFFNPEPKKLPNPKGRTYNKIYTLIPIIDIEFDNMKKEMEGDDKKKDNNNATTPLGSLLTQNESNSSKNNHSIKIADDIYMSVIDVNRDGSTLSFQLMTGYIIIKSRKKTTKELVDFVKGITDQYEEYNNSKRTSNILIYRDGTSNMIKLPIDRYQSFDNIFTGAKDTIIRDIERFKDVDYHERYGIKRKLGYIFTGIQGSGKTCMVTAMAKYLNRTIVYIPISRITKNSQLENLMYNNIYNGVKYDVNDLIFLFDEIDTIEDNSLLKKGAKSEDSSSNTVSNLPNIMISTSDKVQDSLTYFNREDDDKLNIGVLLNILDGNADQDGLIVVGTANDVSKLDPAIYRDGRLEHIEFGYMNRSDIVKMIEYYYDMEMEESIARLIRNDKKIQSLKIKNLCIKHIDSNISVGDLVEKINRL